MIRMLYTAVTLEAAIVLATSVAVDTAVAGASPSGSTAPVRAHCLLLAVMAVAAEALFSSSLSTIYRQRDAPSPGLALGSLAVPWAAAAVATARLRQGLPALFPLLCLRGAIFSSALCLGFLAQRAAAIAPAEAEPPARRSGASATTPAAPPVDLRRLSLLAAALAAVGASAGGSSREGIYFWVGAAAVASVVALHAAATLLPRTVTLGEAIAAVQGVAVLAALLGARLAGPGAGSVLAASVQLSEHAAFTCSLVFWTFLVSFAISALLRAARQPARSRTVRRACVGAAAAAATLGVTLAVHPAVWTVRYALSDPNRLKVVGLWVALMAVALPAMLAAARSHTFPNIVLRKGYHLLAVSLFLPALLSQPQLLGVALAAAFTLLAALEVVRTAAIPGVSARVHAYLASFVDSRDSGALFVTHFTLLLGLAVPVWLAGACGGGSGVNGVWLYSALAGIVTTGLGDAAASVVGSSWGRVPVAPGSRKTVEGTAAGWVMSMLAWVGMVCAGAVPPPRWAGGRGEAAGWVALAAATALSSALEAATEQLDNIFGPLHYFALLLCILR